MIVADLFQGRAEDGMFGPSPKILNYMRVAVEIASFSHRTIDKCLVNLGQCAYYAVGCRVSPSEVGLSDLEDMRKGGVEEGSLSRISISEGLIPDFESSFLWFANIEVPVITPMASG